MEGAPLSCWLAVWLLSTDVRLPARARVGLLSVDYLGHCLPARLAGLSGSLFCVFSVSRAGAVWAPCLPFLLFSFRLTC